MNSDLINFLTKAKTNTYAANGDGSRIVLQDGGEQFEYKAGKYFYKDRYYGYTNFVGQEIVSEDEKVIWGMNYHGEMKSAKADPSQVYDFLKKALRNMNPEIPYRGDSQLKEGSFEYSNNVQGTVESFRGKEEIYKDGQLVYCLYYQGGIIK